MTLEEYKLSSILYGHSLDVRCVNVTPENGILSASRDKTCKFWKTNGFGGGYIEAQTYTGHKNYVSSVCYLRPSQNYPNGVIITGGNDSNICVYSFESTEPIICHKGHSNTVCSISKGNSENTFLTSSWDCTAKLWGLVNNLLKELIVFTGHQAAVWTSIQLPNGNIVTGSADKDIVIWSETGSKMKVLKGHTDCVRGLTVLNDDIFLSVANDASIKQWSLNGECLDTFYGHSNYIYSISANTALGADFFVTSGEDRVVKFWQNGNNYQTIILPAQSIWSVACLSNGDIVTGSSDGLVRVFTQDSSRVADETQLKQFEEEVKNLTVASSQEIGGVKISDLPGKEILYEPGKTDGQTKLVREGSSVVCYSWSANEGTWNKVGDVMGAAGGTQQTSGKTLYEGKEYDFVFSVDIEDGKPPLKLPYNKNQDPWFAAQEFIHKNNLSQMFLDQVANFIIQNSGHVVLEQSSDFVDPFTGGSRYLPGNTSNLEGPTGSNVESISQKAKYFPHMSYLYFDQGNLGVIQEKFIEFNQKNMGTLHYIEDNLIRGIVNLSNGSENNTIYITALLHSISWPEDIVFPVLDITRLAIRHMSINTVLCSVHGQNLIQMLRDFIKQENNANKMLSLRILCNMFSHKPGENLIITNENQICDDLPSNNLNKNCQIALATFLLNLTISLIKTQNFLRLLTLSDILIKNVLKLTDPEAEFRGLVALGNIFVNITKSGYSTSNINVNEFKTKLETIIANSENVKNVQCAKDLCNLF